MNFDQESKSSQMTEKPKLDTLTIQEEFEQFHTRRKVLLYDVQVKICQKIDQIDDIFEKQGEQLQADILNTLSGLEQYATGSLEQFQSLTQPQLKQKLKSLKQQKGQLQTAIEKHAFQLAHLSNTIEGMKSTINHWIQFSLKQTIQKIETLKEEEPPIFQTFETESKDGYKNIFYDVEELSPHERKSVSGKNAIMKIIDLENDFYASGDAAGFVTIWKFGDTNSQPVRTLDKLRGGILGQALTQISKEVLAVGDEKGYIYIYDFQKGDLLGEIRTGSSVRALQQIDSNTLAAASSDTFLTFYDLKENIKIWADKSSDLRWINVIERLGPDLVVTGSCNIDIWSLSEQKLKAFMKTGNKAITSISKLSSTEVVVSLDKQVQIWDFVQKEKTKTLEGHEKTVFNVVPVDRKTVLSISSDCTLKFWDLEWKQSVLEKKKKQMYACCMFSRDLVLIGDNEGTIKVYLLKFNREQQK